MDVSDLEGVLNRLKTANEELERVQNDLVHSLEERVSLLEVLQERFQQRDEIVLEKVIYRVKAKRSIGLQ